MDRIVVDDSFVQQLHGVAVPCLVFNSAGKRLGCFTPAFDSKAYEQITPSVSEDELDRREAIGGGRSLAEILDDLQRDN